MGITSDLSGGVSTVDSASEADLLPLARHAVTWEAPE